jgi:hypothetical protein
MAALTDGRAAAHVAAVRPAFERRRVWLPFRLPSAERRYLTVRVNLGDDVTLDRGRVGVVVDPDNVAACSEGGVDLRSLLW